MKTKSHDIPTIVLAFVFCVMCGMYGVAFIMHALPSDAEREWERMEEAEMQFREDLEELILEGI